MDHNLTQSRLRPATPPSALAHVTEPHGSEKVSTERFWLWLLGPLSVSLLLVADGVSWCFSKFRDKLCSGKEDVSQEDDEAGLASHSSLLKDEACEPSDDADVKVPYGLINQGSTCFLNSVLQVLFMTWEIREALEENTSSQSNSTQDILKDLFRRLSCGECDTKSVTQILNIENVYKQRDAVEYLELLLNRLSPDVSEPFCGELLYKTSCSEGHCVLEEPYPFWTLPLPPPRRSVKESLDQVLKPKELTFYCNECKQETKVKRVCKMTKHPKILALLLKRFDSEGTDSWENHNDMEISNMVDTEVQYSLCGVVDHFGSLRGGHYTATLRSKDGHWFNFNDNVVKVGVPNHSSSTAYLLIYRASTTFHSEDKSKEKGQQKMKKTATVPPPTPPNEQESMDWEDQSQNIQTGKENQQFDNSHGTEQKGYGTEQKGYSTEQKGYSTEQKGYSTEQKGYGTEQKGHGYGTEQKGYSTEQKGYSLSLF